MILATDLKKSFKSIKKEPGFVGSVKSFIKPKSVIKDAVKPFNFETKGGEIIGLLGPNGAGKTTLMKMFTGIIVPTSGKIEILGHEPWKREKDFRKKIALVMGQKSQLWWDIPAMDSFLLLQRYYEIPNQQFKKKIEMMGELLEVMDLMHTHIRKLSLGERMKLELMASLLHSPEIIFLDEPTIGLDLIAQERIRKFLKEYHQENKISMIVTSHYMADVQELCSRLVLIHQGEKTFDGPLNKFETILGTEKSVSFRFDHNQFVGHELLSSFNPTWNTNETQVELRVPHEKLREISSKIIAELPVADFYTEKLPIEKVMKQLMENPELLNRGADS